MSRYSIQKFFYIRKLKWSFSWPLLTGQVIRMDTQSKTLICWICLQVTFAFVLSDGWKAEVETPVEALVSSCVVLPCKFSHPGNQLPDSRLKGIWHKQPDKEHRIYDEDSSLIQDSFKGRTKLIGRLSEKNCSLEINNVRDAENGPFCFRAEIPNGKFSFVEKCVIINMKPEPDKPRLDKEESLVEGTAAIFKCSVKHTCPTRHPTIEWSHKADKTILSYKDQGHGVWEVESLLTFTATKKDDHTSITCTVTFHGNIKSTVTSKIFIKHKEGYFYIIISVAVMLGTFILIGIICCFVTKKYKKKIEELESRNPNRVLSHLSRMSQRSIGRRQEPERSIDPKPYNCNTTPTLGTERGTTGFSKPHFPSPKSEKISYNKSGGGRSAAYGDACSNMGDSNVYGNM